MSKKHFIKLAELIRTTEKPNLATVHAFDSFRIRLADYLAEQNPNFDRDRFLNASAISDAERITAKFAA
jgi:hypothetical protein